jgi:hypothetical protein
MWLSAAEWPPMPDEQIFHTAEDHRLWARNRVAFSEFPSEHDARLEQLRKEGSAMVD